jgi:ABC-type sugar transport system ATPase subunit
VDGFTLSGANNSVCCLLGHNGSGKTSTINVLCGLTSASMGDVFIDGQSLSADATAATSKIGLCPQENILWPWLTVRETVLLYARLKSFDSDSTRTFIPGFETKSRKPGIDNNTQNDDNNNNNDDDDDDDERLNDEMARARAKSKTMTVQEEVCDYRNDVDTYTDQHVVG